MENELRLGLIGWPLGHSLSPALHQAALKKTGIKGQYNLYPVQPLPGGEFDLRGMIDKFHDRLIHGLNVTIPHKQNVIPLLDRLTETAGAIGAVNVIFREGEEIIGDNTDAQGFTVDLRNKMNGITARNALVLGAGGSARAIVYGLLQQGVLVRVAARRIEQANELVVQFEENEFKSRISSIHLSENSILPILGKCDLVVNTTSAGMTPMTKVSPWPAGLSFPVNAFVYDLIYNPRTTVFLSQAQEHGLEAANGLGMLVEQAALAFERWTGVPAPREEMHRSVASFGL